MLAESMLSTIALDHAASFTGNGVAVLVGFHFQAQKLRLIRLSSFNIFRKNNLSLFDRVFHLGLSRVNRHCARLPESEGICFFPIVISQTRMLLE